MEKTEKFGPKNWQKLFDELKKLAAENGDAFLIILNLQNKLADILETEISENNATEIRKMLGELTKIKLTKISKLEFFEKIKKSKANLNHEIFFKILKNYFAKIKNKNLVKKILRENCAAEFFVFGSEN